jgi:putative glutamine amidotransferase
MSSRKPLIGVAPCTRIEDYLSAVGAAGGEALILDYARHAAGDLPRFLDGLVLTGGGDVDPALYGARRHPETHDVDRARDEFELAAVRASLEADLPLLAICRGMQVLNVAEGGDLIQDISSEAPSSIAHRVPTPRDAPAHDVRVATDSRLAALLVPRIDADGRCGVNSRHHQAIGQLAATLEATAVAPDGVIEAVEHPTSRFCVGVQWHPENFWRTAGFARLFEGFLHACSTSRTDAGSPH